MECCWLEDQTSRKILAEKHGLTPEGLYALVFGSESAALATLGKIDEERHWLNVAEKLNLDKDGLTQFRKEFWAPDQIDQDLVKFIESLKANYKTGLLSNAWSGARKVLKIFIIASTFFNIQLSPAEVGIAKPDPAIYQKMLGLMGVEPTQAIFVDDVQANIDAANQLGIHGVRFSNSVQAREDVESLFKL